MGAQVVAGGNGVRGALRAYGAPEGPVKCVCGAGQVWGTWVRKMNASVRTGLPQGG